MKSTTMKTSKQPLRYYSLHESCSTTILLIHGGISSPAEYSLVAPHLQDYHLLIPALPSHNSTFTPGYESQSLQDSPFITAHSSDSDSSDHSFSLPNIAAHLANLVRTHAKNRKAHVVGLSLGGHLAIYLAAHHPEVLLGTVFASGISLFSSWSPLKMRAVPYVFYLISVLPGKIFPSWLNRRWINMTLSPASPSYVENVINGRKDGDPNLKLCCEMFETLAKDQRVKPVKSARTLIVAGTRSGRMYFPDPVEDARFVVERMKEGNQGSKGMQVREGSHPWDVQLPQLFASAVRAWVEGGIMPDGIEDL